MNDNLSVEGPYPTHQLEEPELFSEGAAFAEFERSLEASLDALVARWKHKAAPDAEKPRSRRNRV